MKHQEFGELLTQGLKGIAARESISLTDLQHDLSQEIGVSVWTIYKWRKSIRIPQDDRTIATLAATCVRRGHMDSAWLLQFLQRSRYQHVDTLLKELFPDNYVSVAITQNLPRSHHQRLLGRDHELQSLRNFLSHLHRVGVICISGGGGVGKTALALTVAHNWLQESASLPPDERFDAMVWVTAKEQELLPSGPTRRHPTLSDLDSVYRAIAELLDIPSVFRAATDSEKNIIITRLLAEKRILLILDNLEDIDDQELMVFLRDLPAPSKAIITTRHRIDVAVPIHLRELEFPEAHELIILECQRQGISLELSQIEQLLYTTGGLPLAIVRTIGRMAWRGSNIETEIQQLTKPTEDFFDFCFGKSIGLIKSDDAYYLFMALALFNHGVGREALGYVAGFEQDRRDTALSDLEVLSLCTKDKNRFYLESMTRLQALTELQNNPQFELEARQRWMGWYRDFVERYGGTDWDEWYLQYDYLEADWNNILIVIDWHMNQGRYDEVKWIWDHIRHFTHIYGYWTDRLNLADWIIAEAESRNDWQVAIQLMCDKAFTLTLTGPQTRLEDADALLQKSWVLRKRTDISEQARIAALLSSLCIRRDDLGQALHWLEIAEQLLKNAGLDEKHLARKLASISFDWGEYWLTKNDHSSAKSAFCQMLRYAQTSGAQRSAIFAQSHLAYLATIEGDLATAEEFLNSGWSIATRNKEKRILAFYKRSFSYYYQKIGQLKTASIWANDALDSFQRLGMIPEAKAMERLIDVLDS